MTKTNTAAATFNATDVREAVLFLTNDAAFYDATKCLRDNLAGHVLKGKFDADKARSIVATFVMRHQSSESWRVVYGTWKLAKVDREQVAREVLEHYAEEIQEAAAELAGPEFVAVCIDNFGHDTCGNPTAQHVVGTSTADGGFVKRLSVNWNPRRTQVGYGDYTDGAPSALEKVGIKPAHYERVGKTGDRSGGAIEVVYKRKDFTITL
ncbi:hypothetical protein [Bacteriophage Phobos]|uniref:Uncharacterized protein n=1 Tax=Bacteriophage Phobos TaxID=2662138 RepID=A0A5Q2U9G7_9CAUD|nr:hypothetical protein JT319_gp58 [Bacteriophage Phobos]QGH45027.1 hypothetical protein [Bacteriophage Phobos]